MTKIAVIGSGSFGTAIAKMLSEQQNEVVLLARREEIIESINSKHINPDYLSDVELPESLIASCDYEAGIKGADVLVLAVPSLYVRQTAKSIGEFVSDKQAIVVLSKGLENESFKLMNECVADELGANARIALLSGPNHAEEIARGIPSATVIAAEDENLRNFIQEVFHNDFFRVYTSSDVVGVGLCGATKNVIAIAAGAVYGYGFGDNTAAVIMTRGCAEISRLVEAAGGSHRTSTGLAGIGDLIVTCGSKHSRNRRFGEFLGKGGTFEEFKKNTNMVVEGVNSCKAVLALAKKYGVEMPICEAIEAVVFEGLEIKDALAGLFARPKKEEFDG